MEHWFQFQPEEYLEATRQSFFVSEYAPVITKRCGIQNNHCILEVGCGTGAFSRYIARCVKNAKFIGIDRDQKLLNYYNQCSKDNANTFSGILGDALHLPLEDEVFDAVCSHTFLTCIPKPKKAMEEMIRVCKKGGVISSITTMSWEPEIISYGQYPRDDKKWMQHFQELYQHMYMAYYKQFQGMSMAQGVKLNQVPALFRECGLKEVSVLSIGRAFSLSDAAIGKEEKKQYICNFYLGERKKAQYLLEYIQQQKEIISEEIIQEFIDYLTKWRDFWLSHLDDNDIWEWSGGAQLLTSGRK